MLDDGRSASILWLRDTRAAVPLPRLHFVIDFDDVLAGGADNAPIVKHHARDRVVVRIGIEYGPGA